VVGANVARLDPATGEGSEPPATYPRSTPHDANTDSNRPARLPGRAAVKMAPPWPVAAVG
jgi:hypothetical protein